MCILSLLQGHSDSCECDKCVVPDSDVLQEDEEEALEAEEPLTVEDLLAEAEQNHLEIDQCVKSLEVTSELLCSVLSDMKDLRTLSKTSSAPDSTSFQTLSSEAVTTLLCGSGPSFQFSLRPFLPVPSSLWKSSRFTLQFTVTDADGATVDRNLLLPAK